MADSLHLFLPLLEQSDVVYFAYNLAAKEIVYASPAYEQLIGDPLAHLSEDLPLLLARVYPDDWQYISQQLAQATPGQPVQHVELRLTRGSQAPQWVSVTVCQHSTAEGGAYLVGTVHDITHRKELAINAEKFNTKKDATLEILSHDLAAPLVLLQQLAEQLSWEVSTPSAMAQELLRLMQRTCTQGVKLIRDFVDTEFLESVNVDLKRERADLVAWLRLLMEEYLRSQQHTNLRFSFQPAEQPIYVNFDVNKLQQVVNNLISNAIKFTPDGGLISVSIERQGEHALLIVADTGIGIPKALQPLLFDKFTKARRPGLRGEVTTGLGMSVINTIVALHQGRIWLDSAEGQGSVFYVELPALPI